MVDTSISHKLRVQGVGKAYYAMWAELGTMTLWKEALIIGMCSQVAEAMSEQSRNSKSVAELKQQLVSLQEQVSTAHQKLHHTQVRPKHNPD